MSDATTSTSERPGVQADVWDMHGKDGYVTEHDPNPRYVWVQWMQPRPADRPVRVPVASLAWSGPEAPKTTAPETITITPEALIDLLTTAATIGRNSVDCTTRGDLTHRLGTYGLRIEGGGLARAVEEHEQSVAAVKAAEAAR